VTRRRHSADQASEYPTGDSPPATQGALDVAADRLGVLSGEVDAAKRVAALQPGQVAGLAGRVGAAGDLFEER
jgi:hypothetical protein